MKVKQFDEFEEVDKTTDFCPNCGLQNVYVEKGDGDYYTGPSHYCLSCKFTFTMPSGSVDDDLEFSE